MTSCSTRELGARLFMSVGTFLNEDAGRYRLTFFRKSRRFRLVVDGTGTVIQRSTVDFGDRSLPASIRNLRT